jgi:hypothetical protein
MSDERKYRETVKHQVNGTRGNKQTAFSKFNECQRKDQNNRQVEILFWMGKPPPQQKSIPEINEIFAMTMIFNFSDRI